MIGPCDKGMMEALGIAKKELEFAYYRVSNGRYYDSHTVDSSVNMLARYVLDCRIRLGVKENYALQDPDRLVLFQDAQQKLETAYLRLSMPRTAGPDKIDEGYREAIGSIEICEDIELTPTEIKEN